MHKIQQFKPIKKKKKKKTHNCYNKVNKFECENLKFWFYIQIDEAFH